MIEYQVVITGLAPLQAAFSKAPQTVLRETATAVNKSLVGYQAAAKELAPVDTSRLRTSLAITPATIDGSTVSGSVGTSVKYAEAQEGGSGIYGPTGQPIRPKSAKVLAFPVGGKMVFAHSVKGVRGRFYMKGSLERNQTRTDANFATAAENVALAGGAS
jgi:hypothetical protein